MLQRNLIRGWIYFILRIPWRAVYLHILLVYVCLFQCHYLSEIPSVPGRAAVI